MPAESPTLAPASLPACDSAADQRFFAGLAHVTRFLFVRHGQSEGNARGIIQGRLDLPLDATGRAQAAALAPWIAAQSPDLIVASPLVRAAETAGILASACSRQGESGIGLVLDERFAELDAGLFTGLSFEEAALRHPEAHAGFTRLGWDGVTEAEGSAALFGRAMEAWSLLRNEALLGAKTLVAVSHGGFLQWLLKTTMGNRDWMPLVPMSNCGVSELLVEPAKEGGRTLLSWKRIDFQPPGVSSANAPIF